MSFQSPGTSHASSARPLPSLQLNLILGCTLPCTGLRAESCALAQLSVYLTSLIAANTACYTDLTMRR